MHQTTEEANETLRKAKAECNTAEHKVILEGVKTERRPTPPLDPKNLPTYRFDDHGAYWHKYAAKVFDKVKTIRPRRDRGDQEIHPISRKEFNGKVDNYMRQLEADYVQLCAAAFLDIGYRIKCQERDTNHNSS